MYVSTRTNNIGVSLTRQGSDVINVTSPGRHANVTHVRMARALKKGKATTASVMQVKLLRRQNFEQIEILLL